VSFIQADLAELGAEGWLEPGFDAIVGRLTLLHLDDPVALLRRLVPHLHPGGVVVFQEPDLTRMGVSWPPIPGLEQLCEWVRDAHRALGVDSQFGLRLRQVFQDAGLPPPRLKCEAFIGSGPSWGWYDQMLHAARNAMPVVLSTSITAAEEAGLDTLAEQVREAVASQRSVTRAIDLVSAWTRTAPAVNLRNDGLVSRGRRHSGSLGPPDHRSAYVVSGPVDGRHSVGGGGGPRIRIDEPGGVGWSPEPV
jgi:hypothetical protein